MTLALLDGDVIAYRASVAAQDDIDWDDGHEGPTVNLSAALENAHSLTDKWLKLARADKAVVCFSPRDGGNFRTSLTDYKTERGAKPVAYWDVVESLEAEWETKRIVGLEADDVMGILATSPKIRDAVMVSIDKDLKTIPARLLNPLNDKRPRRIRPLEADRFWMFQTLTGDPIDGYKGCPGVGKVGATKLLQDAGSLADMWEAVASAYEDRGLSPTDALLQARLSRILRREDYDKEKDSIYLWHPNTQKRPKVILSPAT